MTVVTPKTNFITLLEDLISFLDLLGDEDNRTDDDLYQCMKLCYRCKKALGELEDLPELKE